MEPAQHQRPSRRHSIAVALRRLSLTSSEPLPQLGQRRGSIQDSLINFSKNLKLGAGCGAGGTGLTKHLTRASAQDILASHFKDKKLKISKMNFKEKTEDGNHERSGNSEYQVEIIYKSLNVRRRLDLNVRILQNKDEDGEFYVHQTIIKLVLPIPEHIDCSDMKEEFYEEEDEVSKVEDDVSNLFILENLGQKGFKDDILDLEGLDYEHSIMAICYLAKFHATSYCYRKEENFSLPEKYSLLEDIQVPKFGSKACMRVENILKKNCKLDKHADLFVTAMRNGICLRSQYLEHFRVLCHGNFLRENLRFSYKTELESRYFCSDLIFQDLGWAHFGSCVLDLLQFLFTSVDNDVRQNFLADFVCSVYYDNFVKTVISINQKLSIFRLKHFIREFEENILYGFLFNLDIQLKMSKLGDSWMDDSLEGDIDVEVEYVDRKLEENIISVANDIIQFKLNSRASILN